MDATRPLGAKKAPRGFTLLELTVAIVVLGILAALAVPTFVGVINGARQAAAKQSALAAAQDAIDQAAQQGSSVTTAFIYTAANEVASGAVSAESVPSSVATGGGGVVRYNVTTSGSNYVGICVVMPSAINAAPVFANYSGSGGC